jgi:hypothetical protein
MDDRPCGQSERSPRKRRLAVPCSLAGPDIARQFAPEQIDLDGLAQAIRCLLAADLASPDDPPTPPDPDLLLPRRRATHVVGCQYQTPPET